jgi:O-antigen ligase
MVSGIFKRSACEYVNFAGIAAALIFALCAWLSMAGASIALAAFSLAFLLSPSAWPLWRRDPMLWLSVIFVIYVVWRTHAALGEFPETHRQQIRDALGWIKLLAFLPFAWCLRGCPRRIHGVLILALAGLLVGMLRRADWRDLVLMTVETRTGFSLKMIFSGLVSSTAILGLLVYAPRILSRSRQGIAHHWRWAGWVLALYLSGYMLIASESRSAWLAAFAVIPPILFVRYRSGPGKTAPCAGKAMPLLMLAVGILLTGLLALNSGEIRGRLLEEKSVVIAILKGEGDRLPRTSIGFRYDIQKFGWQKWLERPWFGWGTGSTEHLIEISGRGELIHPQVEIHRPPAWMDHFHNTYLEIMVRFGLCGILLFAAMGWLIGRALWRGYGAGLVPGDLALFLAGGFALLAIWNLFDFRVLHGDWRAYWVLLAGIAYSFAWHPDIMEKRVRHG